MPNKPKGKPSPLKRRCKYCRAYFLPNPSRPKMRFCSETHRKAFWKYGGLPYDKMLANIEGQMVKLVEEFKAKLELLMKEQIDRVTRNVDVLTFRFADLELKVDEILKRPTR